MSEPLRVVYLGKLADLAGADDHRLDMHAGPLDWTALLARLDTQADAGLGEALDADSVKVALNGAIVPDKAALMVKAGDEIAFLPPVSGG